MNSIDLFVKNWASKQVMNPIAFTDISTLESQLTATLPESYKYLLLHYGLVHSPNVLTKICDLGVDISEVQDFLSLEDVYSLSKLYEMTGMPKGHILFASDCKGNMFCFKLSECLLSQADIAVWFYNQHKQTIEKTADTFDQWLTSFTAG